MANDITNTETLKEKIESLICDLDEYLENNEVTEEDADKLEQAAEWLIDWLGYDPNEDDSREVSDDEAE